MVEKTKINEKEAGIVIRKMILNNKKPGAAIASSVDSSAHIILPPGFESEEHHLRFYLIGIVKFVLYLLCEKKENERKWFGHFYNKRFTLVSKRLYIEH